MYGNSMINNWFVDNPDNVIYDIFLKWLSEDTIKKISYDLQEPDWMLEHRLYSLKVFREIKKPSFWVIPSFFVYPKYLRNKIENENFEWSIVFLHEY